MKELRFPLEKPLPVGKMKSIEDQLRGNYPIEQLHLSTDMASNQLQLVVTYHCQAWELRRITTAFIDVISRDLIDSIKKEKK